MEVKSSTTKEQVESYYDDYVSQQNKTGVNARHRSIMKEAKRWGLQPNHRVLEVGCGIGTLTSLLAKYVSNGSVTACDISPKSIAFGQKWLQHQQNIKWVVTDMTDFASNEPFDFIVLPDVLEHIPVDQHAALFKTLRQVAHAKTRVFAHFPHPKGTEWSQIHRPDKLQVIDQSLHAVDLLSNAYGAGFIMNTFESYSLWEEPFDYQRLVLSIDQPAEPLVKKGTFQRYWTHFKLKYFA